MKQIKCLFMLLIGATFATSSLAATPSDASLNQLSTLIPYEPFFLELTVAPIAQERSLFIYGLQNDSTLTDAQREKAIKTFDDYMQAMLKQLDTSANKEALKKAYITAARTNFTQAEVDAQIAFYGSQAGRSALEKSEKVYADFIKTVAPNTEKTINSYQKANFDKMQEELKRILNK